MDRDLIRKHIQALSSARRRPGAGEAQELANACWPGGPADRSEPVALDWVRRWRPARAAAPLPVCSCAAGRCAVCN